MAQKWAQKWVIFGPSQGVDPEDGMSEDGISEDGMSENDISEDDISEDGMSEHLTHPTPSMHLSRAVMPDMASFIWYA